jgi:hypothetical protein
MVYLFKVLSNSDSFFVCLEFMVCVLKGLGQQVMVLFFVCLEFLVLCFRFRDQPAIMLAVGGIEC